MSRLMDNSKRLDRQDLDVPDAYYTARKKHNDHRGSFEELFNVNTMPHGQPLMPHTWKQVSYSTSKAWVLRGIHCSPYAKFVSCVAGSAYDCVVDLRPQSPSYGKWSMTEISAENGRQMYIPPGCGHAFLCGKEGATLVYLQSDVFDPAVEKDVLWSDKELNIKWPLPQGQKPIVSDKDAKAPTAQQRFGEERKLPIKEKEILPFDLSNPNGPRKVWYAPNRHEAFGDAELDAVTECLRTGWLAPGPLTMEFENQVSKYFGKNAGLFVNSGSSANMIGIASLHLPKGSEVITPACTFATVLAPVEQLGLKPVFVDVIPDRYVPSLDDICAAVTPKTKLAMIPNLVGGKIDWEELKRRFAAMGRSDIILFEDSCDTMTCTPCTDISAISFYASHIITAGGCGGMVMFKDPKMRSTAMCLRDWGRIGTTTEDVSERFGYTVDGIEYDFKFLYAEQGFNMKCCEMNAAFGLQQMKKLKGLTQIRRNNIDHFVRRLKEAKTSYVLPAEHDKFDWLAMPLQHDNRTGLLRYLESNNVQVRCTFSGNITRHPAFRHHLKEYKNSDLIMRNGFLVGAHHGLIPEQIDRVCDLLIAFDKGEAGKEFTQAAKRVKRIDVAKQ